MEEDKKPIEEKICKKFEEKLEELNKEDYTKENSDYWFKTLDNLKDTYEIKKMKEELKMYRDNYEREYREPYGANYRRRGVPGTGRRYRGEDIMEDVQEGYQRYMEERDYNGYGSPEEDKSFKYMIKPLRDFIKHIMQEASTPEQKEMLKNIAREVMENV